MGFEGNALLRRLVRTGVLAEDKMKLDYVLALKTEDFLERRLQTQVFKLGLAKSIHHARVLIRQDISVSENRLLIFPPSLFVLTHKNTSTSVSSLPSEVAVPAVSRGRMQRRERLDLTREKILTKCDVSKIIYLKNK